MSHYSDLSIGLTKQLEKNEKKQNGIYFTPPETIRKNMEYLKPYMDNVKEILEPSCGSCEYISAIKQKYDVNITGIEYNNTIYESIKHLHPNLIHDDFITHRFDKTFDLIIGNPPYFVMKKNDVDKEYHKYFDGRPNIFLLFLIKSLKLLSKDGILSFVLPKSFLNCIYYDKTRKYIIEHFHILTIMDCNDKYIETQQDTIIIIIQNKSLPSLEFYKTISNFTLFGTETNIKTLQVLYEQSATLDTLGFDVHVGTIVWNQCKQELSDDDTKTRLIYSSDIVNNELSKKTYKNKDKKNYIERDGLSEPLLVINRGYGKGKYTFNYCIVQHSSYLIENHLICIKPREPMDNLMEHYDAIVRSFQHKKTQEFIDIYFGNNAINTIELCKILPIYI
jgi:type I restriction-modification system DNA methylase subunit